MVPKGKPSRLDRWNPCEERRIALVLLVLVAVVALLSLAVMPSHPNAHEVNGDTDYTLEYDGSLYGKCELTRVPIMGYPMSLSLTIIDQGFVDCSRLGPLVIRGANEPKVRFGAEWFDSCVGDAPIHEIPSTSVRCWYAGSALSS